MFLCVCVCVCACDVAILEKEQVLLFAKLYNAEKEVLLTLWLADQVYDLVKDEEMATDALRVAESQFKYKTRRKL